MTDQLLRVVVHLFKKNLIIVDFLMLDSFSLYKLHDIYCMNLYGCELWN